MKIGFPLFIALVLYTYLQMPGDDPGKLFFFRTTFSLIGAYLFYWVYRLMDQEGNYPDPRNSCYRAIGLFAGMGAGSLVARLIEHLVSA